MKYHGHLKRAFDLAVSSICVISLTPPMTLLIAFNAAYLRENPFYLAERLGKNQKPFKMIKVKTLRTIDDEDGNLLPEEQRETPFGHLLRHTGIDEIPQLINVIKGDMSLVGPRPNRFKEFQLTKEQADLIYAVRPGITGPWQVSVIGTKKTMPENERIEKEISYVRDGITFKSDLGYILRTPLAFILGHDGSSLRLKR